MKLLLLCSAAIFLACAPSHAGTFTQLQLGTAGGGTCAFGIHPDGCTINQNEPISGLTATGPPTANSYTVQHQNFFSSYATQSGQTYGNTGGNTGCVNTNCHPPWNVAGVDYPVGPRSNPTTDPSINANLPVDCGYCPSGSTAVSHGITCPGDHSQEVFCNAITGGNPNLSIVGYNFSATAQGCVRLRIGNGPGTGTLTITDNYFGNGSGCWSNTSNGINVQDAIVQIDNGTFFTAETFSYNTIDGMGNVNVGQNTDPNIMLTVVLGGGSSTVTYNAIVNSPVNALYSCCNIAWNFIFGNSYGTGVNTYHSHLWGQQNAGDNTTPIYWVYNTGGEQLNNNGGTAQFWTMGFTTGTFEHVYVDHSIFVNNTAQINTNALVQQEEAFMPQFQVTFNYFDPHSTPQCVFMSKVQGTFVAPTMNNNVDMLTGEGINSVAFAGGTDYVSGPTGAGHSC